MARIVLRLVLSAFILTVAGLPVRATATVEKGETLLDRVVATVNGDVITWSEIHETKALGGGTEHMEDDRVLEELIVRRLLLQEADLGGIGVSDDEVSGAVGDIQAKYGMTDREFRAALDAQKISYQRYRQRIREEIIISRYLHRTIRGNIVVSEAELDAALEAEGLTPGGDEEIRLKMILLRPGPERNLSETEALAREIHSRIQRGENFESLAREYSDAPSSDGSGDVGYVRRDSIRADIAQVAFSLEPGAVSEPFVVGNAVYLLRVDGRRTNDEDYRRRRAELLQEKTEVIFQEKYRSTIRELKQKASIEYPP